MNFRLPIFALATVTALLSAVLLKTSSVQAADQHDPTQDFRTSDRCVTCHNNLKTAKGEDVSIGREWSASLMANAARDPYWQGSVRREVLEHPESSAAIQNECATCHMPLQNLAGQVAGAGHRDVQAVAAERGSCRSGGRCRRRLLRGVPSDSSQRSGHCRQVTTATLLWPRRTCIRGLSSVLLLPTPTAW